MSIEVRRKPPETQPIEHVKTRDRNRDTRLRAEVEYLSDRHGRVVLFSYPARGSYAMAAHRHQLSPDTARTLGEALIELADQAEGR